MKEKIDLRNYLLPGRLREKDGYYHVLIDTKNPLTKEPIRHSESTKLKVIESTKAKSKENLEKAYNMLTDFRKKWTDYHFNQKSDLYFTDYMKKWLKDLKSNIEYNTYRSYKINLENTIIPYFEPKKILLSELKAKDIQEFYNYLLNQRNLSANTVVHFHANIRKALQTALKQELVLSNQADLVDKPKVKKYIANVLTPSQIFDFLENIKGTHLFLPTFLSMYYGLRRSEALGMLWSNVDFENDTFTIANALIEGEDGRPVNRKGVKTKSSYRVLPLIPEVKAFLLDLKKKEKYYKKIFKKSYNRKYLDNICIKENGDIIKLDYVTKKFTSVARKLGYDDIHFHCLRHSFATNMYLGGMSMKELQAWLGHTLLTTTMDTYAHLPNEKLRDSSNIVSNIMKKGKKDNDDEKKNDK